MTKMSSPTKQGNTEWITPTRIHMPTNVQQEYYKKRQIGLVKNIFQVLNQELINTKGVTSQSRNVGGSNIPIIGNE